MTILSYVALACLAAFGFGFSLVGGIGLAITAVDLVRRRAGL